VLTFTKACDHVALTVKSHVDQDEWSNISNLKEDNKETRRQREKDDNVINSEFLNDLMDRFQSMQNSKTPLCDASYASSIAKMLDEAANSTKSLDECAICLDPIQIESAAVTPCFHLFCHDCLLDILKVGKNDCPVCAKKIDSSMVLKISRSDEGRIQTSHWLNSQPKIQNEDGAARQMLEIAVRGSSSSKLGAIMQELDDVWREDPGSKVLIFSQFLGFLGTYD
jgi:DNA repair protein RAD5